MTPIAEPEAPTISEEMVLRGAVALMNEYDGELPYSEASDTARLILTAALVSPAVTAPVAEPGWETVSVKGFRDLMEALGRAASKGYMPDAMAEEWDAFTWKDAPAAVPIASAEAVAWVDREELARLKQEPVVFGVALSASNTRAEDVPLYALPIASAGEAGWRTEPPQYQPGTVRICVMRDGPCPHGLDCPYVGVGPYGYPCKPGWNSLPVPPTGPKP